MTGPASITVEPATTPYVDVGHRPEAGGLR
jgi:hypothetical protein